jgi:hypothetical protein
MVEKAEETVAMRASQSMWAMPSVTEFPKEIPRVEACGAQRIPAMEGGRGEGKESG